jgi:fatty-acyl-CoA synthase
MNTLHYAHWPAGVPYDIAVPATSLFHNLVTTGQRYPTRLATNFFGAEQTWGQVLAESQALAAWLQVQAQLQDGDRVALYMQNCPQFVTSYYGLVAANGVGVPVNVMLTEAEVAHIVNDSGARVAIVAQDLLPRVMPLLLSGQLKHVLVVRYGEAIEGSAHKLLAPAFIPDFVRTPAIALEHPACVPWSAAIHHQLIAPRAHNRSADDLALLPYTSGTTGKPKGCRLHHSQLNFQCVAGATWTSAHSMSKQLLVTPMFHITGFVLGVCMNTYLGTSMAIMPRWDRELAAHLIAHYRLTHWTNIPTMIIDLLASPNLASFDLSSLERVGGGGAAMPEAVAKRWHDLTGLDYFEGYGLSETAAPSHYNPPQRPKLQCLGVPFISIDSRIIDPETLQELPQGQAGEIITHGPCVLSGYWNDEEKTAQAFIELDGKRFFRTGDLARIDEDGYFFMVDRLKRMINASGFKVWPAEVESTMYQHPEIAEVCIIASGDSYRGETVKAVVVKRANTDLTAEALIAWSRERMAAYKVPRLVEFVSALPKSGAGKVLWRVLQEQEQANIATKKA